MSIENIIIKEQRETRKRRFYRHPDGSLSQHVYNGDYCLVRVKLHGPDGILHIGEGCCKGTHVTGGLIGWDRAVDLALQNLSRKVSI